MSAYKKITDLKVYVQELLNSGAPVCTAEKTARILACPGVRGNRSFRGLWMPAVRL